MSTSRLLPAVAVGLSALLLSGCAGSATPGVAVTVGEETISTSRINEATSNLCVALGDRFEGQSVPLSVIRQGVVQLLALGSQAEQIADDYGLRPGATYRSGVAEQTRLAAEMPAEVRDDFVEVLSTQALASDIRDQVGRIELADQGFAEPTDEDVLAAGTDVFATWPDRVGIEVDPKYGVALVDGQLAPVDTNLSFAVSDLAKAGIATEPDPAYAAELPSSQRCGG